MSPQTSRSTALTVLRLSGVTSRLLRPRGPAPTVLAGSGLSAGGTGGFSACGACHSWNTHHNSNRHHHHHYSSHASSYATSTTPRPVIIGIGTHLNHRPHPAKASGLATTSPFSSTQPSRRVLQTSSNPTSSTSSLSSPVRHSTPSESPHPLLSPTRTWFPYLTTWRARSQSRLPYIMGDLQQTRESSGGHHHHHGHGHHHHHHDNTYLLSSNKNDPGVRITRIGLLSNLGMAIAKFIGGYAFNSKAMIADAWHSIADLASDILTLATVSWSMKPPTEKYPMGFGKIESMGSIGVSGMLLVGGLYMGWESAISLYGHFINAETAAHILEHVGHGHSHSHAHSHGELGVPSLHAAWLALGTILVKEWLYQATMKVARDRKSSVLASNAIHHRVDSLTGIVTLFAILGANLMHNAAWLDPVGGLLISIMVIHAGYANSLDAFKEVIDHGIDDELKASVRKQARSALAAISEGHQVEVRDVNGFKSGQNHLVDIEMIVPGKWTIDDVKEVEDAVRTRVGAKVKGVRRIRVRFISQNAGDLAKFDEYIPGEIVHDKPEEQHEDEEHDHDHDHDHKHDHKH